VKAYAPRENAILDKLAEARASAIASQSRGDIFTDGSALAAFQVAQDQVQARWRNCLPPPRTIPI
jgi:hypothetical protein